MPKQCERCETFDHLQYVHTDHNYFESKYRNYSPSEINLKSDENTLTLKMDGSLAPLEEVSLIETGDKSENEIDIKEEFREDGNIGSSYEKEDTNTTSYHKVGSSSSSNVEQPKERPENRINAMCPMCKRLYPRNFTIKEYFKNINPELEPNLECKCKECDELFQSTRELLRRYLFIYLSTD